MEWVQNFQALSNHQLWSIRVVFYCIPFSFCFRFAFFIF